MIKRVYASTGEDITQDIIDACEFYGIQDPLDFTALLMAESGMQAINIRAERWGSLNNQAMRAINTNDMNLLSAVINAAWPDIGFGAGQQIVKFHYFGDNSRSPENCLAVRERVLSDHRENIFDAAKRFSANLKRPTFDGSPPDALSAMIYYNAGSDQRGNAGWMNLWKGNVESYKLALIQSRRYFLPEGEDDVNKERIAKLMDVQYGVLQQLAPAIREDLYKQLFDVMVGVKEEAGLQ